MQMTTGSGIWSGRPVRTTLSAVCLAAAAVTLPFGSTDTAQADDETIVTSHGISTFGDLKYPADYTHFDFVNPDAPKGGEMSTWAYGTFDTFNRFIVKGTAEWFSNILYESLMARSHDEADTLYGLLAESITYPEPGRQWAEFKIRPEARFSDGSPVTAADVVFSYEMLSTKGSPAYRIPYGNIEKVEALDDLRVRFTFKDGANVRSMPLQAASMPVFAKSHFEDREFDEGSIDPLLTSGPYVVESAKPGQVVVYRRNEDYWGQHLPFNAGRNNFDRLVIEYYTDYTAAFEGFKGGAYDFREEYYSKLWSTAYDFPEIKQGTVVTEVIADGRPSGGAGILAESEKGQVQGSESQDGNRKWRSISNGQTRPCSTRHTSARTVSGKTRFFRQKVCRPRLNWNCLSHCEDSSPRRSLPNRHSAPRSPTRSGCPTGSNCGQPEDCSTRPAGYYPMVFDATPTAMRCHWSF